MKVKTSITLSDYLLKDIDRRNQGRKNRSEFIETALIAYLEHLARQERNAKDLRIINKNADRLNQEDADVLAYQVDL
jgi:metal-responsive CopG/Arc/MetJ family transcriptional regulator